MKKCNKILFFVLAAAACAACGDKAGIRGTLAGAPNAELVVKQLNINTYQALDTIKTGADGSFRYNVKVKAGQPEFVYLFYGDTRVAALLLEKGETATVQADTLGRYTVSGSDGSVALAEVDRNYADFIASLQAHRDEPTAMTADYLRHYRESVKYVMANPFSMTVIPVLFERLGDASVFSQATDAILFRQAADSLLRVYPDSRYVKALDKEAARRMNILKLDGQLQGAPEASFPDIRMPDIHGELRALSEVGAKVILVHFWDAADAAQKMLSVDTLLPLYEEFHDRGFEIYSVCVSPDKPEWASTVLAQKLPWINVNDGLGVISPAAVTYGVSQLPYSFLIVNGEVNTQPLEGTDGVRREILRALR